MWNLSVEMSAIMCCSKIITLFWHRWQGDQIGPIFANSAIVKFSQFFYRSCPNFWATFFYRWSYALVTSIRAIFVQTHPVTLSGGKITPLPPPRKIWLFCRAAGWMSVSVARWCHILFAATDWVRRGWSSTTQQSRTEARTYDCLSVCLSLCLYVCLSICLSLCLCLVFV
jgi:hypothetical protein